MNEKPDKMQPALFGGLTIALISSVPLISFVNCFCCAGVMFGGFVAVHFYNKKLVELETVKLESSDGVTLGLMSGAFGAIIGTIFSSLIGTNVQQQLQKMMDYSQELPPELEDALIRLSQYQEGFTLIILSFLLSLVIYSIFAIIGALIAVSLTNKRRIVQ
ncbi:MAG: hypothetical protein GXO74_09080 [Calditrichaeota bacterium]|nr:hypothetical protein [Calditrichota bacterium]